MRVNASGGQRHELGHRLASFEQVLLARTEFVVHYKVRLNSAASPFGAVAPFVL